MSSGKGAAQRWSEREREKVVAFMLSKARALESSGSPTTALAIALLAQRISAGDHIRVADELGSKEG